jgi:hypothetical protein
MADTSLTKAARFYPPKDLLVAAQRHPKPKTEQFRVEGWKRSWFSWISERLVGKD